MICVYSIAPILSFHHFSHLEKFPTNEDCINYLEKVRWDNTPSCPYCNTKHKSGKKGKDGRYSCSNSKCNKSYRVTVGTILHDTKIPLQKWFIVLFLILDAKRGISSCQIARVCGLNQKTAWYMAKRINKAMEKGQLNLLKGIIEIDETYVGGKPRKENIKKSEYEKDTYNKRGKGAKKDSVIGMVERKGSVIAKNVKNIVDLVNKYTDKERATFITDEYKGYSFLSQVSNHKVIKHKDRFANDDVHTNTTENFWAILKRGKRYLRSYK